MAMQADEVFPPMQDVRAVRREVWRQVAIARWPLHLLGGLLFAVAAAIWLAGLWTTAVWWVPLVMGLWTVVLGLFPRQIQRAFCGSQAPLVFARGDHDLVEATAAERLRTGLVLVAGGGCGLALALLLRRPGGDDLFRLLLAGMVGLGVVSAGLSYARTGLWEMLFVMAAQAVALAVLLAGHGMEAVGPPLCLCVAICGLVVAASFALRWRRWVRALPESVRAGEA